MTGDEREVADARSSTPDAADSSEGGPESTDRRRAIKYGALAGLAGILGVGAALQILDDGPGEGDGPPATETETEPPTLTADASDDDAARALALAATAVEGGPTR